MTQEEAHEVFQLPEYDILTKYIYITSTMLFTVFYQPVIPIGSICTIVYLIITYYIDKVNFFYYNFAQKLGLVVEIEQIS